MKKHKVLAVIALLASLTVVGCSKKDAVTATSEALETIAPETTAEQIADKLEEKPDYTVPTIGTTEAVVDAEGNKDTVGITETFEDDSYMAVMPDGDVMISLDIPDLASGHEYSEEEALAIESLYSRAKESGASSQDVDDTLNSLSGLSDSDKEQIKADITSKYPSKAPEKPTTPETKPQQTELQTTAPTELEPSTEAQAPTEGITPSASEDGQLNPDIEAANEAQKHQDDFMNKWFGGGGVGDGTGAKGNLQY
jgi:hypothetical protein